MEKPLRNSILAAFLISASLFNFSAWADDEDNDASGFGKTRIESEFKLTVPKEIRAEVWEFISTYYSEANLKKLDPALTSTVSVEYFVDVYYDNEDLFLLEHESAVRHRTRIMPDNPSHPKHGRSLMQLKLRRPGDADYNRSEIKFPIIDKFDRMELAAPVGLVKADKREDFKQQVVGVGISPFDLKEKITLNQKRSRVYISREGSAFATITFDEVSSKKWWESCEFIEVEMELNEINYTEGDAQKRAYMEGINNQLKSALQTKYPQIKQDQTPKYNKAFNCFSKSLPMFKFVTKYL